MKNDTVLHMMFSEGRGLTANLFCTSQAIGLGRGEAWVPFQTKNAFGQQLMQILTVEMSE